MEKRIKMFEEMLDDTVGAIDNEKIWAAGSETNTAKKMHLGNIAALEERKNNLSYLIDIYEDFSSAKTVDPNILKEVASKIEAILEEEKTAETEYVDFLEELYKEVKLAAMTE